MPNFEPILPGRESAAKFNRNFARLGEGNVVSSDGSILITRTPAGTDLRAVPPFQPPALAVHRMQVTDAAAAADVALARKLDTAGSMTGDAIPVRTHQGHDDGDQIYAAQIVGGTDKTYDGAQVTWGELLDGSEDTAGGGQLPAAGSDYMVLQSLSGAWVVDWTRAK